MTALTPHIRRALPLRTMAHTQTHRFTKRALGGGWIFLILLVLAIILLAVGYIVYQRFFKSRFSRSSSSSNYPAPAATSIKRWITDRFANLKRGRNRQQGAGYEPSGGGGGGFMGGFGGFSGGNTAGGTRGRGHALDPDEAWDARVGNEAYFEEQELGIHMPNDTSYPGGSAGGPGYAGIGNTIPAAYDGEEAQIARSRELDNRYDEEMHGGARSQKSMRQDPFGDEHALRTVDPRPLDTSFGGASRGNEHDSPTERKSAFRENV